MCRLNRSAADDDAAASGDDVALGVLVVVGSLWAGHANGRCSVGGGAKHDDVRCKRTMFTCYMRALCK